MECEIEKAHRSIQRFAGRRTGYLYDQDDLIQDTILRLIRHHRWETATGLLKIFVNGVTILDILKAIRNAQRERARSGFNRQLQCSTIIKAIHKPLQVIPKAIRPIDAAA